jgi:hypothetical protein
MKRPNYLRTFSYIKRLADLITFGKIAKACGKEIGTAEAWGREPESNENPHGTGKKNPLDCVLRLIALAHKESPALAREMAEIFTDYSDYLEGQGANKPDCVHSAVGQAAKEHMDVVLAILNTGRPNWHKAFTEIKEAQAAMYRVEMFVKNEMKEVA